jgi:hypothetical protein
MKYVWWMKDECIMKDEFIMKDECITKDDEFLIIEKWITNEVLKER